MSDIKNKIISLLKTNGPLSYKEIKSKFIDVDVVELKIAIFYLRWVDYRLTKNSKEQYVLIRNFKEVCEDLIDDSV